MNEFVNTLTDEQRAALLKALTGDDFKSEVSIFHDGMGYNPPNNILLWSFLRIAANLKDNPGMLLFDVKDNN